MLVAVPPLGNRAEADLPSIFTIERLRSAKDSAGSELRYGDRVVLVDRLNDHITGLDRSQKDGRPGPSGRRVEEGSSRVTGGRCCALRRLRDSNRH